MKLLFSYPLPVYIAATVACLCIMILVDFLLGAEAEHLNAWVIINRLFGNKTSVGDSLAIRCLGLYGAAMLMLFADTIFGILFIQLIRWIIGIFHSW